MENNRRIFLKLTGLTSPASLIPLSVFSEETEEQQVAYCTLIPTETAGPFPLDLTANTAFFRKDIRENKTGVLLQLKLKIIGANNCEAMQNVRVNIWHCDKDGLYSGYSQSNNSRQADLTYLRGYQFTDANGVAEFTTIFPGWYSGRICHIHFQIYVSSSYAASSQLSFDITKKEAIYTANSSLYTKGADPTTLSGDNIFSDGYTYQIATLTDNATTGGYDAYLEVAINGNGIATGQGKLEKENAKNFTLGQNFPNPYSTITSIPVHLNQQSNVVIDLYDLQGKKMTTISESNLPAGDVIFQVNMKELGLPVVNYIYQIEVKNSTGIYRDCKMMTALQ